MLAVSVVAAFLVFYLVYTDSSTFVALPLSSLCDYYMMMPSQLHLSGILFCCVILYYMLILCLFIYFFFFKYINFRVGV